MLTYSKTKNRGIMQKLNYTTPAIAFASIMKLTLENLAGETLGELSEFLAVVESVSELEITDDGKLAAPSFENIQALMALLHALKISVKAHNTIFQDEPNTPLLEADMDTGEFFVNGELDPIRGEMGLTIPELEDLLMKSTSALVAAATIFKLLGLADGVPVTETPKEPEPAPQPAEEETSGHPIEVGPTSPLSASFLAALGLKAIFTKRAS